jgi:hypothetical protein
MMWVLLITAAWLAVSMPLALLVGRAIRTADRQATHPVGGPLSFVGLGPRRPTAGPARTGDANDDA